MRCRYLKCKRDVREIKCTGRLGGDPIKTKMLTFDKYNGLSVNKDGTSCLGPESVVPVYSHAKMKCSWPISEKYAETMLLLHDPTYTSYKTLKGDHETYVERFKEFLKGDTGDVPEGLTRCIARACIQDEFKTGTVGGMRRPPRGEGEAPPNTPIERDDSGAVTGTKPALFRTRMWILRLCSLGVCLCVCVCV